MAFETGSQYVVWTGLEVIAFLLLPNSLVLGLQACAITSSILVALNTKLVIICYGSPRRLVHTQFKAALTIRFWPLATMCLSWMATTKMRELSTADPNRLLLEWERRVEAEQGATRRAPNNSICSYITGTLLTLVPTPIALIAVRVRFLLLQPLVLGKKQVQGC